MDDAKKSKNSEKFDSLRNKICLSIAVLFTIWALFYSKALPLIAGREYVHFPNYLTYIFYKNDLNNAEYQKNLTRLKMIFIKKKRLYLTCYLLIRRCLNIILVRLMIVFLRFQKMEKKILYLIKRRMCFIRG